MSDSTVSLRLSPGFGQNLPVNLRVGRYQRDVQELLGARPMYPIFSYDRPVESQVSRRCGGRPQLFGGHGR